MVDDKQVPPSPENEDKPSDEVTLDINSFDDEDIFESSDLLPDDEHQEPMEDFAFHDDTPQDEQKNEHDLDFEQSAFDARHESSVSSGLIADTDSGLPRLDDDELFADIFERKTPLEEKHESEQHESEQHDVEEHEPYSMSRESDTDHSSDFDDSAFEDINADFPESEPQGDLGDSQLFDYDASAMPDVETESVMDDVFADGPINSAKAGAGGAGGSFMDKIHKFVDHAKANFAGGGGSEPPVSDDAIAIRNKRIVRTAAILVLVVMVYGVLRLIMPAGEKPITPLAQTTNENQDRIPGINLSAKGAEVIHLTGAVSGATSGAVSGAMHVASATGEHNPNAPIAPPHITGMTGGMTGVPPQPLAQHQMTGAAPMPITGAMTAATPAPTLTTAPMPTHELPPTDKMAHLQTTLTDLDKRISDLNAQIREEKSPRMDNTIEGQLPSQKTDEILTQALQKIDNLDKKLSQLAEVQQQIKGLNSQIQVLKTDIVQQSTIVGQAQREINENTQVFKMTTPEPVRIMVQAAIPGRAWLRSESGELYTVIPGDEVPGYGKVVSIDASSGTVVMSSRAVIREQF